MSVASPPRLSPGNNPFEYNIMYGHQRTPSHSRQHVGASQPSQIYHIPPTPDGAGIPLPYTPSGVPLPYSPTRGSTYGSRHPGNSSPASGYFGLEREEDETHIQNNWSAGSSIRSAAARSPMVIDPDALPYASEEFRRQSIALKAHHSLAAAARQPHSTTPYEQVDRSRLSAHYDYGDHASSRTYPPDAEASPYGDIIRRDSPQPMLPPGLRSLSLSHASLLSPEAMENARIRDGHVRAATLPTSAKVDGVSLMYGSKLDRLLESGNPETVLLLDLRSYQAYSQSRIEGAINISVPTTLLKRPAFNIAKLADSLGGPDSVKRKFAKWKTVRNIVVYDAHSVLVKECATAAHTVSKFIKEGWTGEAYLLSGGFDEFHNSFPDKVDKQPIQDDSKTGRSLSLSHSNSGSKPAFNCVMPATKSAANPFFSNIRQNMDLIGGVGEIPILVPTESNWETVRNLPRWIRELAYDESGTKKVSDKFLRIEKTEQKRMQDALNVSVQYFHRGATPVMQPHALAGVEKGTKNRYNNIWPYEHSRVKLESYEGSCDYVNASYVSTEYSSKRYIATQGPLPSTFQDFWSVVWDQDVRVIVMLTAETEGGQLKCHSYWKDYSYGPFKLTPLSERRVGLEPGYHRRPSDGTSRPRRPTMSSPDADISPRDLDAPHVIVRKFTLSHSSRPFEPIREITQLQYSSWPDFGAPASPAHILSLIEQTNRIVRSSALSRRVSATNEEIDPRYLNERPILVHCSAGCGRTGTFCAADSVIDMLKRQREAAMFPKQRRSSSAMDIDGRQDAWVYRDDEDLVAKAVSDLRDDRLSMVQSLRQFVLCYETVLEWLVHQ